jgi:uncharacterized tellurite resistance protein B-like protein
MNELPYNKLLLLTAFCCMASDGHIDDKEVALIKSMCEKSLLFNNVNIEDEINQLVIKINSGGKVFIKDYLNLLENTTLSENDELILIDFAIQTIKADEQNDYSEIKFFKNIRHRLKVSDDVILNTYPDIEMFLEEDISTESSLDKITNHYLENIELPQFKLITIDKHFN